MEHLWVSRHLQFTAEIENHRTGLVWRNFMANPEITSMLARIGFVPDSTRAGNKKTTNALALSAKPH